MESVKCICKECESEVGQCINLWTKLGDLYVSPVIALGDGLAIEDNSRIGNVQSGLTFQHCLGQGVVCAVCLQEIGFKCIATPVNHVLEEGQVFLKFKRVVLRDDEGGEVDFVFKRVLDFDSKTLSTSPMNSGAGPRPSGFETVDVFKLQSELQLQREDISRINTDNVKTIRALATWLGNLELVVTNLQDTLGDVCRNLSGAEEDIKSVKTEVDEVKQLAQSQAPAAAWEERLGSVTTTIGELKEELGGLGSQYKCHSTQVRAELRRNKQDIDSLKDINQRVTSALTGRPF